MNMADILLSVIMVTFGMWIASTKTFNDCDRKHESKVYFNGKISCEVTERHE